MGPSLFVLFLFGECPILPQLFKFCMLKNTFYTLAALVLLIVFFREGQFVLAPLTLALLFSVLVSPVAGFLEKKKWPRVLSVTVVTVLLFVVMIGTVLLISNLYYRMLEELPELGQKVDDLFKLGITYVSSWTGLEQDGIMAKVSEMSTKLQSTAAGMVSSLLDSVSGFVSFMVILPIFMFLLLFYRDHIKQFVLSLPNNPEKEGKSWEEVMNETKSVLRNYLLGLLMVIVILGVLNTLGLFVLGIPFALVLGFSSAVLTILPYIGNLVGGGLALVVAFATKDNPWMAVAVLGWYVVVQFLEGNIITPKIQGDQLGLNPLVIILALLVGGYIWGIMGMILSVPLAAVTKVLISKYTALRPLSDLMGE